jgi:protein MpaA
VSSGVFPAAAFRPSSAVSAFAGRCDYGYRELRCSSPLPEVYVAGSTVRLRRAVGGLAAIVTLLWATGCGGVTSVPPGPPPTTTPHPSTAASPATARPVWTPIGKSVEGRPILMATFGGGDTRVLIVGGVHGNEYGAAIARGFADFLAAHPGWISAGRRVDVIWCLDPDGKAHGWRGNAHRVDLNRNFPTASWRSTLDSRDGSAQLGLTGGPAPESEPETRALLSVLRTGYRSVISLHSPGGFVDFNRPRGAALAEIVSRASGLPLAQVAYQPYIAGSMGEYVPAKYHIPIVTIELRSPEMSARIRTALLTAVAW